MGLFGKKLSPEQKDELQHFVNTLNATREACKVSMDDFKVNTLDFYHICFRVRAQGRELQETECLNVIERPNEDGVWEAECLKNLGMSFEVSVLIDKARDAVEWYTDFLKEAQSEVASIKYAVWYPKKFRKALDSWTFYFQWLLMDICLGWVAKALQPPRPLTNEYKNPKLKMFVDGLGRIYQGHRDLFPKPLKL